MFIYQISNTKNNFVYIGMTTRNVEARWKEHLKASKNTNRRLYRAMRKHGVENFSCETVAELKGLKDKKIIFLLEKQYIKEKNSYWFGYNNTTGGRGYWNNRPKRGRKGKGEK